MIYLFVILMTLLGSLGAFFFKKSTESMQGILSLLKVPNFYIGGFLYALGAILNIILLRYIDYTVLYPISAICYVWSLLIANRFLGEQITAKKILGIVLIIVGIILITR